MKKRVSSALLVSALALAGLTACGNDSATDTSSSTGDKGSSVTEEAKVAFIPKLTGVGFFEAGGEGAVAAGPKYGLDVQYLGSPEASVAKQTELVNTYVDQGFKGIIVSSTSPDGLCNSLNKAKDAGAVVLTWDSDTNPECRQFYISQGTPDQMGQLLVDMTAEDLKKDEEAEIAFHYSSPTVTDQNQWVAEAEKLIDSDTNWKVVDKVFSENKTDLAVQRAEALINAHPNLKAILCPDANALPGTAKALQNLGREDIVVVGFSTPNALKEYIESDTIKRFALWDVKKQGELAVAVAKELIDGKTLKVGDKITVEGFGELEVQDNSVQGYDESTNNPDSGVIVLPERLVFDKTNIDDYDF